MKLFAIRDILISAGMTYRLLSLTFVLSLASGFRSLLSGGKYTFSFHLKDGQLDESSVSAKSGIDERELAKIFGRLADKMILLDVEGAGTPEMMNCCKLSPPL